MMFRICVISSYFLWMMIILMFPFMIYLVMLNKMVILEWHFCYLMNLDFSIPIIFDPVGMIFSIVVLFISSNILYFSEFYMSDEVYISRFIKLVLMFVMSMNLLIYIPSLMCLLLGWDGLGIVSYLLVIYYQNPKSLAAGMITALTNRVGDVMILLSIGWLIYQGHWNIMNMWLVHDNLFVWLLIMVAAMTKSAQIPFSSWLPAAMAAPTPVSALVHSSTLVTAGVFLLIRFYEFLNCFPFFNMFLLVLSCLTMFMAGVSAMLECDMKKIIALSTLSQLGVMMGSIGLDLVMLSFLHLITHALFKALLFVCAGGFIHLHFHNQDLRLMGNLYLKMPFTMSCFLSANMALCGMPFMAGFYSKDMIIEMMLFNNSNFFIIMLFIISVMFTSSYTMRLVCTCIISNNMYYSISSLNDEDIYMGKSLFYLTLGAICSGSIVNWFFMLPVEEPMLSSYYKFLAFIFTMMGGLMTYIYMSESYMSLVKNNKMIHYSNVLMWFMVPISSQVVMNFPLKLSKNYLKFLDHGWNEVLGGEGMKNLANKIGIKMQEMQVMSINVYFSFFLMILFFMIMIF